MNILTNTNPASTAAKQLDQVLAMCTDRPVLLMLSGGSALTILEQVDTLLLGPHVTVTTLDERFSTDPDVNNFAQIAGTDFYQKAIAQGAQTISTAVETSMTLTETGERFDNALHHWRESHQDGVVIATMGVGTDGHTAGIFPHQSRLDLETTDWVVSYEVPSEVNLHTMRVTVTPVFLKTQVTQAVGLITGEGKRPVLEAIQSADCTVADTPACVMRDMSAVTIVTDL